MTTRRSAWGLAGAAALLALLTGCIAPGPAPTPSRPSSPMPSHSAAPTSVPTSVPTPVPTPAPAVETSSAPVVRVPASCDSLYPVDFAESISDQPLKFVPRPPFSNPIVYSDARAGSLLCRWIVPGSDENGERPVALDISVYPGVSAEAFTTEASREGGYITTPEPSIGEQVYSSCLSNPVTGGGSCGYIGLTGDYAVTLSFLAQSGLDDGRRAAVADAFRALRTTAASFDPPAALWQPAGPTLAGADSCDALLDPVELTELLGAPAVVPFKQEAGEYANSHFGTAAQSHAYWCSWTDYESERRSAFAAVLPGGASYFAGSAAAYPEKGWAPSTDYPGEAYVTADGGEVAVLIDGGWVAVRGPAESLPAIADAVLRNVGAVGR